MNITFNFGRLRADPLAPNARRSGPFRIALLGDFSGRAHRGELRRGDALARCKPMRLDVDTLDRVIASFGTTLQLPIGRDGATLALHLTSLDDLHPDRLHATLPLFTELKQLRGRLGQPGSFKAAADEVRRWCADAPPPAPAGVAPAHASTLRIDAKLSDFARLLGRPLGATAPASPLDELLRQVVAPHVVEAAAPDAPALIAAVDRALGAAMRSVLHDPDFQALEAAWRSLDFVARRVETDESLQIVVYDISADEFAADLSSTDDLQHTVLYRLLIEQPALDAHEGPLSALIGNFGFEMTPPHAELLGRVARLAARARAPFIAAIGRDCIGIHPDDLHPRVRDAWAALHALPAARHLMLAVPRFLLRTPYGERSDPIDSFDFEEFDAQAGLKALLWGNPAILAAVLLAAHAQSEGGHSAPGAILSLGDMPYFFHTDAEGETVALPCTERLLGERLAALVHALGFVPVLAHKGRPEVRLGGFLSVAGAALAGPWGPHGALADDAAEPAAPLAAAGPADRAEDSGDAELDALLAALKASAEAGPPAAGGIDPDLAALLADL